MYEIHGGCGFSKKLLFMMSQITYCAARLQQEPESPVIPVTAHYLMRQLLDMRQWSRESIAFDAAQQLPPSIEWVRERANNFVISIDFDMTNVTAEAWRIAAMIYMQCRVFRYEPAEEVLMLLLLRC